LTTNLIALPFKAVDHFKFFLDHVPNVTVLYIPILTNHILNYLTDRKNRTPIKLFYGVNRTEGVITIDNNFTFKHIDVYECTEYPKAINNVFKCQDIEQQFFDLNDF
jgi:hypothetical protein